MPRKKRKIGFYYLTLVEGNLTIQNALKLTLDHINSLPKSSRRDNLTSNKFGFLDTINSFNQGERNQLIFKSATHSYRPPLLDSVTTEERDSPKRIEEGDRHKTHIVTKAVNGDVILVIEKYKESLNIQQLIKYLNMHSFSLDVDEIIKFEAEAIAKDNFLEEINALERVTSADIYEEKQLLGGNALNYSDRISTVKHEIIISVKAKNRSSITELAKDVYAKLNGGERRITRLKVIGRNSDNNIVKINTDLIEKQEYVMPNFDETTGEVFSNEIIQGIESSLFNYR